jgi:rhamnosyltransferase
MPKVSIIIRTKNEEKWIEKCLKEVFAQNFKDFEVIVVENGSEDKTPAILKQFPVKVVEYKEDIWKPGKALNVGIRNSSGDYIVSLSGHCIPAANTWLEELVKEIESDKSVVGVYGKNIGLPQTSVYDKRDMLFMFGPARAVQTNKNFFHFENANSMVKRSAWEELPFDEDTTHIENIIWGREMVLSRGYTIIYTPKAAVYHHHGIHQYGNEKRAQEVVEILESLEKQYE